jgi:hypothetical protein
MKLMAVYQGSSSHISLISSTDKSNDTVENLERRSNLELMLHFTLRLPGGNYMTRYVVSTCHSGSREERTLWPVESERHLLIPKVIGVTCTGDTSTASTDSSRRHLSTSIGQVG